MFPELTSVTEPPSHIFCVTEDQLFFMSHPLTPQKGSPEERGGSVAGLGYPNINIQKTVMREKAKAQKRTRNKKKNAGYAVVLR